MYCSGEHFSLVLAVSVGYRTPCYVLKSSLDLKNYRTGKNKKIQVSFIVLTLYMSELTQAYCLDKRLFMFFNFH